MSISKMTPHPLSKQRKVGKKKLNNLIDRMLNPPKSKKTYKKKTYSSSDYNKNKAKRALRNMERDKERVKRKEKYVKERLDKSLKRNAKRKVQQEIKDRKKEKENTLIPMSYEGAVTKTYYSRTDDGSERLSTSIKVEGQIFKLIFTCMEGELFN